MEKHSDSASPTMELPSSLKSDVSDKFREQINIMDMLHLKNPTRLKTEDLLRNDYFVVTPIDPKSAMSDAGKFLDVATKMVKADSDHMLSKSDLRKTIKSDTTSADQKTVAAILKDQFRMMARTNPDSGFSLLSYLPGSFDQSVQATTLEAKKANLDAARLFAKHPELTDAKTLANTVEGIMKKIPEREHGLAGSDFELAARSAKFTEQERAAAELVHINMPTLLELSDRESLGRHHLLSKFDVNELGNLGLPPEQRTQLVVPVRPGCEEHTSVVGNAAKWGIGVGAVSKIAGSEQSGTNAAVATSTAALAAIIKNSICEK